MKLEMLNGNAQKKQRPELLQACKILGVFQSKKQFLLI